MPERLESAGRTGIPQVVSLGALDMVNFGPMETVPERYRDRNLYVHNPTITLMRTTPEECRAIGRIIAAKLNAATGPTVLFVPLRGVSAIDVEGQVFYDAEADAALFETIRELVDTSKVELHEVDADVNDPAFALAMANRLHELITDGGRHDTAGSARAAARADRGRQPDHRGGRRHRALGEVRRGRRHRPDHHLQLRPLPHGRARLARRADALRRRERDRRRHGPRGAPGRQAHARAGRASAAPTRSG